jgi:hypothetical protein
MIFRSRQNIMLIVRVHLVLGGYVFWRRHRRMVVGPLLLGLLEFVLLLLINMFQRGQLRVQLKPEK